MAGKRKIFGTGLSGLVGSRFTELLADNFESVNLDLATGVDITDYKAVNQALNQAASTVVHLAAFTDVSKAFVETGNKDGLVYQINVLGTRNIAAACKKFGHYLIHISTDFVFDGQKQEPYTEADQPQPIEWYGQTKLLAETEVVQSGCRSVIIRIAFPFRANFAAKQDLVRKILTQLKSGSLPPMFSDQIITPTFIDDLCQALKLFINHQPGGIYHVVGSTWLSPYDLAQKIAAVFKLKAEIKPGSFKEFLKTDPRPRQKYLKISNTKLFRDFGYKMKTIDEALVILKDQGVGV